MCVYSARVAVAMANSIGRALVGAPAAAEEEKKEDVEEEEEDVEAAPEASL
jgi:hypothetical protein